MSRVLVGVDIGGTAIKIGIISTDGTIIESYSHVSQDKSFITICSVITNDVKRMLNRVGFTLERNVVGVGIVMPGKVNPQTGVSKLNIGQN